MSAVTATKERYDMRVMVTILMVLVVFLLMVSPALAGTPHVKPPLGDHGHNYQPVADHTPPVPHPSYNSGSRMVYKRYIPARGDIPTLPDYRPSFKG